MNVSVVDTLEVPPFPFGLPEELQPRYLLALILGFWAKSGIRLHKSTAMYVACGP